MQQINANQHHPPRSTLDIYLDYKNPSARMPKLNIVIPAPMLPSMCLEAVFRFCGHGENMFFSTENAIITGTLKCPYGMVRYRAVYHA